MCDHSSAILEMKFYRNGYKGYVWSFVRYTGICYIEKFSIKTQKIFKKKKIYIYLYFNNKTSSNITNE